MTIAVTLEQVQKALEQGVQQSGPDTATQALGEKFKSMMARPQMAAPVDHTAGAGTGTVGKLILQQDAEFQRSLSEITTSPQRLIGMSMQEMVNETARLSMQLLSTQMDLEAKMSVVNVSRSDVETLLKNQ
jgi:type III secretion inner rod protein HrpB2